MRSREWTGLKHWDSLRERRGDENKFTIFITIALIELLSVCSTYRVDGKEVEGVGDHR